MRQGDNRVIEKMLIEYSWFLKVTEPPKEETLAWISNRHERIAAFKKADSFVGLTVDLTKKIAEESNYLRYLIV